MFKEFPFYIDKQLKHKLDLLLQDLDKNDVWIIVDGDEGAGKTNTAAYLLYYAHCVTGRPFSLDHFYFDTNKLFDYIKNNSEALLNWDEAALGALSTDWYDTSQKNLLKFAMTGRKKHHFFVLCIPKFTKLQEYIRVDRTHALINMTTGKDRKKYGRYIYLTRRGKAALDRDFRRTKIRRYSKFMKAGGFGGNIPYVFDKILDEKAYDKKKDDAIANIGVKPVKEKTLEKLLKNKLGSLRIKITKFKYPISNQGALCKQLGVAPTIFNVWRQFNEETIEDGVQIAQNEENKAKNDEKPKEIEK